MSAPICPTCETATRLTTGAEIYPLHPHLAGKAIYTCDGCGARVGCHPGTTTALGLPADAATRRARMWLHNKVLDPIWQNAWRDPAYRGKGPMDLRRKRGAQRDIARTARNRVYAYLADKLGLTGEECHTGLFDIAQCHAAAGVLRGVSYGQIREWAREREGADRLPVEAA